MSPARRPRGVLRGSVGGRAAAASLILATAWFAACSKQTPLSAGANQRPTVEITSPHLNQLFPPELGPSIHAGWTGFDPDGRGTTRPVQYKFKLFGRDGRDFPFSQILGEPDSLRRRYAPHFSEWDSVGGDTTQVDFRNLPPGQDYIVAVVAFDEAGAYSPVMSFDTNLLFCHVLVAGTSGPKLTVFSESF